jgi:hypothetical protein
LAEGLTQVTHLLKQNDRTWGWAMTEDHSAPVRAAYYRIDEKTRAGEAVFHFRFYGDKGRWLFTKAVPISQLQDELDALRSQRIPAQRIT